MIEADIRRLLAVAADDQDAPTGTPVWLRVERVRAYRRRQRQVGSTAVLGIASTVAGVAITLGTAEHSAAHPPRVGVPLAGGSSTSSTSESSTPAAPLPNGHSGDPQVLVRTETRTAGGRVVYVVVPRTARVTTSVPGDVRTLMLRDTVTASSTVTATQTATQTQTDTTTRSVTSTRTVTTTVHHTVTVTPPQQTVTVTTSGPSQTGPQVP